MPSLFNRLFKKDKAISDASMKLKVRVGTIINQRYRLDAEIGRGGMGIIFCAYDLIEHRKVAFKVINPETANALSIEQFRNEVEILSKLQHPHIVSVYETGQVNADTTLPFLAMELLNTKSLANVGTLTYARIVFIAQQLCEVLAYIHGQGIVYRDLKPDNILLEKRGFDYFIKLVDFGLARPREEAYKTNESSLAGTLFYLAPELIAGQLADISSDLYALGILLYELIVGRVPFFDIDEQTIRLQHQQQNAPPPSQSRSDVPPVLDSLVIDLLAKNPQSRPCSAQAVLEILRNINFEHSVQGNLPHPILGINNTEIQPIIHQLENESLITLPTKHFRLVLASAAHLAKQFSDGVWYVELEQVQEPEAVLPIVFSTFALKENPNRPSVVVLIEFLREKNLLLIFAHCGQVYNTCSHLISAITDSCPDVRLIVVSDQSPNSSNEI